MRSIWRRLGIEQRVAGVAAVLLIISTIGPFSWVEAGIVLTGGGVLALLRARGYGRRFHLPFGDGPVIMLAAVWAALLILSRIGDRPFGQTVLAWVCAALLAAAGLRERDRRPPDDVYRPRPTPPAAPVAAPDPATAIVPRSEGLTEPLHNETPHAPLDYEDLYEPPRDRAEATRALRADEDLTEPLHNESPHAPLDYEDLTAPLRDETEATRPVRGSRRRRPAREDDPPRPR